MNPAKALRFFLLAGLFIVAPLSAHHSAAQFDFRQTVIVEGTVKELEVRNPHIKLVLEVVREDGSTRDIEFEGHSRNNVYRRGWRPTMIDIGDEITIGIAPMRDGSDGGYVTSFHLADGTEF